MKINQRFNKDFINSFGKCSRCGCDVTLEESDFDLIEWNYSDSSSSSWTIECPSCSYSIKCSHVPYTVREASRRSRGY